MRKIVSILLPIRNEEKYIKDCIESILTQDYPSHLIELLIIDGMSDDSTLKFISLYLKKQNNIFLLKNPSKVIPVALNLGISQSKGDIIIRMDGHSVYPSDYVSKCIEFLEKTKADNVGGVVKHEGVGFLGHAISFCQTSIFGLGGAKFRISKTSQFVDTVFPGAWCREVFDKYGYFNEKLVRNQDIEFNARIRKMGGKIFLTPEITATYYVRNNLWNLFKQNFRNGFWNIKTIKINQQALSIRHFVPLFFVLSLLFSYFVMPILWYMTIISYIIYFLYFSFKIAVKNGIKYFFISPLIFIVLHISYGFGMLFGILTLKFILN